MKNHFFKIILIMLYGMIYANGASFFAGSSSSEVISSQNIVAVVQNGMPDFFEYKGKSFDRKTACFYDGKILCGINEISQPSFLVFQNGCFEIISFSETSHSVQKINGTEEIKLSSSVNDIFFDSSLSDSGILRFVYKDLNRTGYFEVETGGFNLTAYYELNEPSENIDRIECKKINGHRLVFIESIRDEKNCIRVFEDGVKIFEEYGFDGKYICEGETNIFVCLCSDSLIRIFPLYVTEEDAINEGFEFPSVGFVKKIIFYRGYFYSVVRPDSDDFSEKVISFNDSKVFEFAEGFNCDFLTGEKGIICFYRNETDELSLGLWPYVNEGKGSDCFNRVSLGKFCYLLTLYGNKFVYIDIDERKLVTASFENGLVNKLSEESIFCSEEAFSLCREGFEADFIFVNESVLAAGISSDEILFADLNNQTLGIYKGKPFCKWGDCENGCFFILKDNEISGYKGEYYGE